MFTILFLISENLVSVTLVELLKLRLLQIRIEYIKKNLRGIEITFNNIF